MKILIVHPGFSFNRQLNHFEAIIKLLGSIEKVECHIMACNKAYLACGFRGRLINYSIDSLLPSLWEKKCLDCQYKLIKRVRSFCSNVINVTDYIYNDINFFDKLVQQFPKNMLIKDFLSINIKGVNVGADIWQSIQYSLFMGTPETIIIPQKNSIGYEFLRSGLILFEGCYNLLKENHYDLLLLNEISYMDWGIPTKVALSLNIPVIRQGNYYLGPQKLTLKRYNNLQELSENHPLFPTQSELGRIKRPEELYKYADKGQIEIVRWMCTGVSKKNDQELTNIIKQWIRPNRKTVVVFTHLCWDSSIAYGIRLYATFEEWLSATFEYAANTNTVDWIFRIHPSEKVTNTNQKFNTMVHLNRLMQKFPCDHIKIMDSSVNLKTIELIPYIHVGISLIGTVFFELPCFGIPCIVAATGSNVDIGFTINPSSIDDYRNTLKNIADLNRLPLSQQKLAQAYVGLVFDENRFLNVGPAFNTDDSSDERIDPIKLDNWITMPDSKTFIEKNFCNQF